MLIHSHASILSGAVVVYSCVDRLKKLRLRDTGPRFPLVSDHVCHGDHVCTEADTAACRSSNAVLSILDTAAAAILFVGSLGVVRFWLRGGRVEVKPERASLTRVF